MALFEYHIHNHVDLSDITKDLKLIIAKINIMAKKIDEILPILGEINEATNNIAADLDRLADQAEGGLTPEEATSVVTQLRSAADALKAVAARNPEDGTPTPEPEA